MKKQKSTFDRVKDILCENAITVAAESEVTLNADLDEDLGMDSLDRAELALDLEAYFDLDEITDAEAEKLKTVADVVALVDRLTTKVQAAQA